MNPIAQGLALGYSAQKILGFITKAFPALSPRIKQAQSQGHSIENILGFISKTMETPYPKGMSQPEIQAANAKKQETLTKNGLTAIAGLAGSKALAHALPNNLRGMFGVGNPNPQPNAPVQPPNTQQAPNIAQGLNLPGAAGVNQQNAPNIQNPLQGINQAQQPPIGSNVTSVTQPQVNTQAQVKSNKINELWEAVSKGNVSRKDPNLSMFLKMARQFNHYRGLRNKEQFEQLYDKFEELQGQGLGMPEIARKLTAANEEIIGQKPESMEPSSQELDVPKEEVKRAPIAKSETVATPHGVGEVREVRNGQAIVDVDGKLHKVKEEELEASPIPEKELADLYEDLIKGIEGETGEDVSRMVQWAGYDPKNNTLTFLPHTGKLYKYGDISPEDAALLTDILSTRKTSGENFIGAWKAGSKSPIGAALSKLIRKLQSERGGKGNEYEETHEPIYSAYEPAIQAKKKKKKK